MRSRGYIGIGILTAAFVAPALADVTLIGSTTIPWDAADRSGLTGVIGESKIPRNRLASFGSGLAYTGAGNLFLAVCDRGPVDGAVEYDTRFQTLSIEVTPPAALSPEPGTAVVPLKVTLVGTTLFHDPDGRGYTGSAAAFDPEHSEKERRFDPEAIVVSRSGSVFTSDEYGPWIDEWSASGVHLRRVAAPAKFLTAHRGSRPADELPPNNLAGRQPNRGMEGIAFSPDGSTLFGIMQSPLIQDGALDDKNKRIGTNIRMVAMTDGTTREYVYTLDQAAHGLNELLTVGKHSFLVIEKDGKEGTKAKARRLYLVDITGATDISGIESLPGTDLPAGIVAAKKHLLLDMLDSRFGLAGPDMPEKVEALAFGPDLPDGRHVLIVASDNDFRENQPSRFWAFAIDPSDLPGFEPRIFDHPWPGVVELKTSGHAAAGETSAPEVVPTSR
jgi:hypothetical protein